MIVLDRNRLRKILRENKNKFYTYVLLRNNNRPYYVGVGFKNRVFNHVSPFELEKGSNKLKINITNKELSEFGDIKYAILVVSNNRNICLRMEEKFIESIGRIDISTGCLSNLTDGGEIGPTGYKMSDEEKIKRRDIGLNDRENRIRKSKDWWDNLSEEEREYRKLCRLSGTNSEKARQNNSQLSRNRWADENYRKELIAKYKEAQQKCSDVTSERMKSKWSDPEFRSMMLLKRKEARERKLKGDLLPSN